MVLNNTKRVYCVAKSSMLGPPMPHGAPEEARGKTGLPGGDQPGGGGQEVGRQRRVQQGRWGAALSPAVPGAGRRPTTDQSARPQTATYLPVGPATAVPPSSGLNTAVANQLHSQENKTKNTKHTICAASRNFPPQNLRGRRVLAATLPRSRSPQNLADRSRSRLANRRSSARRASPAGKLDRS